MQEFFTLYVAVLTHFHVVSTVSVVMGSVFQSFEQLSKLYVTEL